MKIRFADIRFSALLAGLWAVSFLLAQASPAQAQQPIRIGASLSQTGSYARLGQTQLRGYQLCIKHVNEKGGVLGRPLTLVYEDDQSQPATAAKIYEKLITQDKVDALLGPYSSPITEAVADVAEKHRMPLMAANAATTSIFKKGRKFVYMMLSPAEVYLEGLIDIAAKGGLKTIAIIHEDTLFPRATAKGAADLAKSKGLQVILTASYPKGSTDFTGIVEKLGAARPDVVAAATYFNDAVALTRALRKAGVNPKVFGVTVGGDLPKFRETLGGDAENVYGGSQWEENLVTLRAGGLIPIARQYPGAKEFVDAYRKEFPNADLSYQTAAGYGACQIFTQAISRAGSLDGERVRDAILKSDTHTIFGAFRVDEGGFQTAHKMVMFQWQDGKKAIVWPEDLAPAKPRFPTQALSQR